MPKCENCKYLRRTSYEYAEYECAIFGEYQGEDKWNPVTAQYEPTKNGHMFTDEGCKYTQKALAKKYEKVENELNKYYASYADYGEWEEKQRAEEKQLKEDLASGKKYSFEREENILCPWCGEMLDWTHYHKGWSLQKCQCCNKWFSLEIRELYTTERRQQICNKEHPEHPDYNKDKEDAL